jgi:excisionase family DNA binding protein
VGVVREAIQDASEPWLDVSQAALHIAAPESRIYDLVAQGKVKFAKDGRRLLLRRSWLDEYIDGSNVPR